MLNKDSFIKFLHLAASVRDPCHVQITLQHNSLKTRINPKLATAFRYLIYKHNTFLRHKVIRALPNPTVICTVMVINHTQNFVKVIITLEILLNEKVGHHFCQVILLFWLRQKMAPYTKYKIKK